MGSQATWALDLELKEMKESEQREVVQVLQVGQRIVQCRTQS